MRYARRESDRRLSHNQGLQSLVWQLLYLRYKTQTVLQKRRVFAPICSRTSFHPNLFAAGRRRRARLPRTPSPDSHKSTPKYPACDDDCSNMHNKRTTVKCSLKTANDTLFAVRAIFFNRDEKQIVFVFTFVVVVHILYLYSSSHLGCGLKSSINISFFEVLELHLRGFFLRVCQPVRLSFLT